MQKPLFQDFWPHHQIYVTLTWDACEYSISAILDRVGGITGYVSFLNIRFGLVWFNGISTFVGYLMPNPFS